MYILKNRTFLITCGRGIVPYLRQEVEQLGYPVISSHETGLEIEADYEDCYKLNLCLRTAMHVMYLIKKFACTSPQELYDIVAALPWESLISPEEYVSVVSMADTKHLKNSMFASQRVKDAIVDRITRICGSRPNSGPTRDNVVINLFWKNNRCWLYVDTSGNKLSDRTYRKLPHVAPLQETLAAALLLAAGYDGSTALVNPMCGSGTLAIEAALIALNRAPGLLRSNYGLMHLKNFNSDNWQATRKQIKKTSKPQLKAKIIASDISPQAVDTARKNAQTAGVDQVIEFHVCDFSKTPMPEQGGIMIMNPEYGVRMGQEIQLRNTYKDIGNFLKTKCAGYKAYVFTGNMRLADQIPLEPVSAKAFSNAKIDCKLFEYDLAAEYD
ncbi:MAG: class I SAM-dependent RNA methyltransferase [Candidatus Omnitrophota bacterium]